MSGNICCLSGNDTKHINYVNTVASENLSANFVTWDTIHKGLLSGLAVRLALCSQQKVTNLLKLPIFC